MKRPMFTHWRADGKAKVGLSREAAFAEAQRISDEDLDNGILMRVPSAYACGECSDWHVGNQRTFPPALDAGTVPAAPNIPHESPAAPLPASSGWRHLSSAECRRVTNLIGAPTHAWQKGLLRVLSSAEVAEYQGLVVPHNHVTVSVDEVLGRRPRDAEMAMVRADFDMVDAEEDNHSPGRIRNLFLPLHLPRGTTGICDCKADETTVVEPDGFEWSREVDA